MDAKNEYLGYREPDEFALEFNPELRGWVRAKGRINGRLFYALIKREADVPDDVFEQFARDTVENMRESEIK
ncbi:MAG: hypothetical protein WC710_14035 [Gallionella sp.]|jgi:hypothetical protein